MSTNVKYFHSAMVGAPVLSGSAGALVSVLDSCLVDGFDSKSVTSGAIASGVATLNFSGTHSSEIGSVIMVTGATPSALNGAQRVTGKTSTSVSFATEEDDDAVSGTVSIKMAPLGWTKAYFDTNKRAYVSAEPASTGCHLRVDDTGTTTARAVGYETMSDVDTGTGPFPTSAQSSGGLYWPKSNAANSSARDWFVIGDERTFYFYAMPHTGLAHGAMVGFGDMVAYKSGDAYAAFITGDTSSGIAASSSVLSACVGVGGYSVANMWFPRQSTALGGSVRGFKTSALCTAGNLYSGTSTYSQHGFVFPNGPDNGLYVNEVICGSGTAPSTVLRGELPGVFHSAQVLTGAFSNRDRVEGAGPYADKVLTALRVYPTNEGSSHGVMFVDTVGPWR